MPDPLTELQDLFGADPILCLSDIEYVNEKLSAWMARHPHLRDDDAPVICPDIRGVRCMACVPYEDLWTSPKVKYDGCLRLDSDTSGKKQRAPIDEPCPCVKEET